MRGTDSWKYSILHGIQGVRTQKCYYKYSRAPRVRVALSTENPSATRVPAVWNARLGTRSTECTRTEYPGTHGISCPKYPVVQDTRDTSCRKFSTFRSTLSIDTSNTRLYTIPYVTTFSDLYLTATPWLRVFVRVAATFNKCR